MAETPVGRYNRDHAQKPVARKNSDILSKSAERKAREYVYNGSSVVS